MIRTRRRNFTSPCRAVRKFPQLARYNYFPDDKLTDKDGFPRPKEILADADLAAGLQRQPARAQRGHFHLS